MSELLIGLTEYFLYYNKERPHQSLSCNTLDKTYQSASGGGAKFVDKYSKAEKTDSEIELKKETKPRQRWSAVDERLPS